MILYTSLIKIAFANMMRMAARDPLWAIVALITFPLRSAKSFVMGATGYFIVVIIVGFGIDYALRVVLRADKGGILWHIDNWPSCSLPSCCSSAS